LSHCLAPGRPHGAARLNEARQKLKIILDLLPITSSLGKVPRHRGGGPSDPLVGGLEPELEPTDQGIPVRAGHTSTARRLEPSQRAAFQGPSGRRGLPDIRFRRLLVPAQVLVPRMVRRRVRPRGGGDEETRTPDPLLAKEMLFQLSYVPLPASPTCGAVDGGRFWTRTRDLCLIRAVL
jgi:hypothetical protein